MPGATSSIRERQNDPDMLSLLCSMTASHARAQRLDNLSTVISVLIAVSALAAALASSAATAITILGGAWALAYSAGLASWGNNELRRAAMIQEMFDVRLFGLPWNAVAVGEEISAHDVSRLRRHYHGDEDTLRDYYEIPDLPRPYDVLACQEQNLGWGARVRRRYAYTILSSVGLWAGAGVLVGGVAGLSVAQLVLRWYIPSLAALLLGLDVYRRQRDVSSERDRVLAIVRERIRSAAGKMRHNHADTELIVLARQVQDVLYQTRLRQVRVPNWFFVRFRATDRIDFQAAMTELTTILGSRTKPTE
jgi:SMODS-associating 4TM effector domain